MAPRQPKIENALLTLGQARARQNIKHIKSYLDLCDKLIIQNERSAALHQSINALYHIHRLMEAIDGLATVEDLRINGERPTTPEEIRAEFKGILDGARELQK